MGSPDFLIRTLIDLELRRWGPWTDGATLIFSSRTRMDLELGGWGFGLMGRP